MTEIAVTRWFSIDDDGQPTLPGWYECLYACDQGESYPTMNYWDGRAWVVDGDLDSPRLTFGNETTFGERWRGLVEPYRAAAVGAAGQEGGSK